MYSYSNTFLKGSICIRIRIHHLTMYSYSITFVCIRPHVWNTSSIMNPSDEKTRPENITITRLRYSDITNKCPGCLLEYI